MVEPSERTGPTGGGRPQQVTLAAWAVVLGSVALIVSAFQQISTLHTLDTRTAVERLLSDQPSGLGFTVEGWLTALKVLGMVSGATSAAAAILGWQALQRSKAARVVLLALAAPLVISGLVTGPVFALIVAAAVVTLWLPAANAWFDPGPKERMGNMSEAPPPPSGPSDPYGQQPAEQPAEQPAQQPAQPGPYGQPYGAPTGPYGQQYGAPTAPYAPPASPYGAYPGMALDPERRPGSVTAAAVVTFILAGLSTLAGIVTLIAAAATDDFYRELSDQGYDLNGLSRSEMQAALIAAGLVTTVLSVAAIVVAAFALRRSRAARIVLTVLSGLTIALSLVGITAVLPVVTLAGAIAVIVMLYQRRANDWFARRSGPRPPAYPGAPGGGPGTPWQPPSV